MQKSHPENIARETIKSQIPSKYQWEIYHIGKQKEIHHKTKRKNGKKVIKQENIA